MREKKNVSIKLVVLLLAVVLMIGCVTGGTLAWLVAKTTPIENTFSAANINITLEETPNADSDDEGTDNDIWVGKMVPGTNIKKDPKVTVSANSEACWLFVKVDAENGVDLVSDKKANTYVTYAMAEGWTAVPDTTGVYYREVDADTAKTGVTYDVISGNQVTIPNTVTKAMLDSVTGANAPSLTFTAYAVQKEGFEDASAAWTEAQQLS